MEYTWHRQYHGEDTIEEISEETARYILEPNYIDVDLMLDEMKIGADLGERYTARTVSAFYWAERKK